VIYAGVLPYRNLCHTKQHVTTTPWYLQAAWKEAENHQGKSTSVPVCEREPVQPALSSSVQGLLYQQVANQSIELLYSQEDLTGPIYPPASLSLTSSSLANFSNIPIVYNCQSSMRRIAWERTLRCISFTSVVLRPNSIPSYGINPADFGSLQSALHVQVIR
jgi:hypothetical protein